MKDKANTYLDRETALSIAQYHHGLIAKKDKAIWAYDASANTVKYGKNEIPTDSFESDSGIDFRLPREALSIALRNAAVAAADNDIRGYLNGVIFDTRHCADNAFDVVGTDGHRLFKADSLAITEGKRCDAFIIPTRIAAHIAKQIANRKHRNSETVSFRVIGDCDAKTVTFRCGNDTWVFEALSGSRYPDWHRVIPSVEQCSAFIIAAEPGMAETLRAFDKAQKKERRENRKPRRDTHVRFKFGFGKVRGAEKESAQLLGGYTTEFERLRSLGWFFCDYDKEAWEGDNLGVIAFNAAYMADAIAAAEGNASIRGKGGDLSMRIDAPSGVSVVMPCRI